MLIDGDFGFPEGFETRNSVGKVCFIYPQAPVHPDAVRRIAFMGIKRSESEVLIFQPVGQVIEVSFLCLLSSMHKIN